MGREREFKLRDECSKHTIDREQEGRSFNGDNELQVREKT